MSVVKNSDDAGDEGRRPEEELSARLAPYVTARDKDERAPYERHLLFLSTPQGYSLVEREGPPPAVLDYLSLPDHDGVFRVIKLAASPLPRDRRMCAYLEQS